MLEAAGGVAPYKWVLQDGWLPAGMKLQEDGVLTGTPEVPGEFFFTVRASDNSHRSAAPSSYSSCASQPVVWP